MTSPLPTAGAVLVGGDPAGDGAPGAIPAGSDVTGAAHRVPTAVEGPSPTEPPVASAQIPPGQTPPAPTLLAPDPAAGAPEDASSSLQAASRAGGRIPGGLVVASEWTWRLLIVGVGVAGVLYLLSFVSELIIPVAIALLLASLLNPLRETLARHGVRGGAGAGLTLLLFVAFVAGLFTLVGTRIATDFSLLSAQVTTAVAQLQVRLNGFGLTHDVLVKTYDKVKQTLTSGGSGGVVNSAISVGSEIGTVATNTFITLFCLFFFLLDGRRIWDFLAGLFPGRGHDVVHDRGLRAYAAITGYVRATVLVAASDAVGIFVVATALRVPLAIPLAVLVFIGAFVPIVGTLTSGTVSVLVAFVAHGPLYAILMLAGVLLVVEVEGHVLQPLLLGRAVRLHPLAVFLSITAGGVLYGIAGIFFAVPVTAALVAILRTAPTTPRVHRGLLDWLRRRPKDGALSSGVGAVPGSGEDARAADAELVGRGAAGN